MQKLFNKILVPVDLSSKSTDLLKNAYSFAAKYNCSLHLLYVAEVSPFAAVPMRDGQSMLPRNFNQDRKACYAQLEKMCRLIDFLSGDNMHVDYSVINGTWNQGIIDFVNENNADLVLIGRQSKFLGKRSFYLNPDLIAERTNIPVITVPFNRRLTNLYSIVIPVTDFLPVRKLMYGVYMAINLGTTIKLLAIEDAATSDKVQYYLLKAYKLIRDNCEISVEMETVSSKNVARAVNHFAMHSPVDLIIVNPGTQTTMPGWFASFLGNFIQKYAAPPVLAVNPV